MAKPKTKSGKQVKRDLLDPGKVLSGKSLWRAANASARIELRPALKAEHRAYTRYGRDQQRDIGGLKRLSNRTAKQVGGIYRFTDSKLAQGAQITAQNAAGLRSGIADAGQAEQQRLNDLQGSSLGNQIQSLAAQRIGVGGSASQDALANAAAQQQAATSGNNAAWDKFAATKAAGMKEQARNMRSANQMQGAQARSAVRSTLASRMADTRAQYGEARRESAGKIADLKALFGPTGLKNIMALRSGERTFVNDRAAIQADARQNAFDNALDTKKFHLDQQKAGEAGRHNKAMEKGGGSGGSGSGTGGIQKNNRLSKAEYHEYAAALSQMLDGGAVNQGGWNKVLDALGKREGVNWSAIERRKFKRRAKKSGRF